MPVIAKLQIKKIILNTSVKCVYGRLSWMSEVKGVDNFELIWIMRPSHRWNDHLFHLKRFEGSCQICREVNVSLEHCHITHDHLKVFHSLVHLFHAFIWSNVASSFSIPCFHIARNHRNIEVRGLQPQNKQRESTALKQRTASCWI